MGFSIKPKLFLAGFIPGFLFFTVLVILRKECDYTKIKEFAAGLQIFSGIAILIISYILGLVFDAIRNSFVEKIFKIWDDGVEWTFFYRGSEKAIEKVDNNFYIFYVMDLNIALCLFSLLLMILFGIPHAMPDHCFGISKFFIYIVMLFSIFILILDAWYIRRYLIQATRTDYTVKKYDE